MRFITEFECDGTSWDMTPAIVSHRKTNGQMYMGNMIAELFGWQSRGETTLHGPVLERHTLEIEAFPIDKWVEFKNLLWKALTDDNIDHVQILQAVKDLESFSKPEHEQSKTTK